MKYFLLITSLLILPFALFASQDDLSKSKGTTQDVIVQFMPSHATDKAVNKAEAKRTVNVVVPQLVSLELESNATSLNLGEKAALTVTGTYEDNSTKELTSNIEWVMTTTDSVEVKGMMLTALKDVDTTVQAKVGNILSNTLNFQFYWEVNGHRLPSEPDPTVNNSTLLGIDVNDNGVRDDVERKVYATYPKAIQRAVMMQAFRAKQEMLADPDMIDNARIWAEKTWKAFSCKNYLADSNQMQYIKSKTISKYTENNQFNTKERVELYIKYNKALSGGVYSIKDGVLQDCEFDVQQVLEMDK